MNPSSSLFTIFGCKEKNISAWHKHTLGALGFKKATSNRLVFFVVCLFCAKSFFILKVKLITIKKNWT